MTDKPQCTVLYDGECPACARYIAASGLDQRKDVLLLDARHEPELVARYDAAGHRIDESMIVTVGDRDFFGADATRVIAELGTPKSIGGRMLLWFVGSAPWARPLYPVLASGRKLLLRILGRSLINS